MSYLQFAEQAPVLAGCATRLEIARVPLLAAHQHAGRRKSEPDLIVRANRPAAEMDVVVHFHGFCPAGAGMVLARDKEPISGLDFCSPDAGGESLRARPTLGLLPRGRYYGGKSGMGYNFPALTRPGALNALIEVGLSEAARHFGLERITMRRFILTGHSGGGAPILSVLPLLGDRPDEVHVFDGLYSSADALARWMRAAIVQDAARVGALLTQGATSDVVRSALRDSGKAMRVLARRDGPKSTEPASARLAGVLAAALRAQPQAAPLLCPFYRVEWTRIAHNPIPRAYGFRLLADASADVPSTSPASPTCRMTAAPRLGEDIEHRQRRASPGVPAPLPPPPLPGQRYTNHPNERAHLVTPLDFYAELVPGLKREWTRVLGSPPSCRVLALLAAKVATETGAQTRSVHNYNLGNAKSSTDFPHVYFTCWECVTPAGMSQLQSDPRHGGLVEPLPDRSRECRAAQARTNYVRLHAPHPSCRFRAFETFEEGLRYYFGLLRGPRYGSAWPHLEAGDADAFVAALARAKYFTAPLESYQRLVRNLHAQIMRRLACT